MSNLEQNFVAVIDNLDLPDVDLVDDVLDQIAATNARAGNSPDNSRRADRRRRMLVAVAATAALVMALTLTVTPVGEAVANWFGIGATAFDVDDRHDGGAADTAPPPTEADGDSTPGSNQSDPVPPPPSLSEDALGDPVEPMPAVTAVASLGPPDAVFDHAGRGRSFLWRDVDGSPVVLSARRTESVLSTKTLAAADQVEFLSIRTEPDEQPPMPAVWISEPHELNVAVDGMNLELAFSAGPVLIWIDNDVELRLEGVADKGRALALAAETTRGTQLLAAE